MKLPYFFTVIVLCANASVQADTTNAPINTVPEGITTFNLPATGVGATATSYFSAPLVNDPIYTGAVGSAVTTSNGGTGPDTITVGDTPPPWTSTVIGGVAATPYFVKFLSGNESGRVLQVLANTSNSLTLDVTDNTSQKVYLNTTGFDVQPGDTFEVFAGDTLGLMFGLNTTQSPLVLKGGSLFTADSVSIYVPTQNRLQTYYFDTTAGYWKQPGGTVNDNNVVIRPYTSFLVTRNSNEPATSFVLTGRVAEVNHLIKTTGSSSSSYDSTGFPVDVKLSQLQLSNWKTATLPTPPAQPSPFGVDILAIWNPSENRFDNYFEVSDSTWRKVGGGSTDQSSFVIPAATTVCFIKFQSASGSTSYLQTVLPYSLTN